MKALSKLMALALAGSFAVAVPLTAAAQVTAKFAVTLPEKSHQGQGVAKFIELVDAKSGGKIKIKGFYAGALGNDVQAGGALLERVEHGSKGTDRGHAHHHQRSNWNTPTASNQAVSSCSPMPNRVHRRPISRR